MFWLKNDETAGRIVRTVLWLSWRRDEAVRILCLVLISGEMLLQLREDSRESCAHLCGGSDGSCSAMAAWFTECARPWGGHEDSSCVEDMTSLMRKSVRAMGISARGLRFLVLQEIASAFRTCNVQQAPASNRHFGTCTSCRCSRCKRFNSHRVTYVATSLVLNVHPLSLQEQGSVEPSGHRQSAAG